MKRSFLLIHPSVVKWDYFEYVIPLLEKVYRLIVPALPGYDYDEDSDFTSVEQIAEDLVNWLVKNDISRLYAAYGCSMGGSIALLASLQKQVAVEHCVMDGGITPYRLPWVVTRVIALKDYLMMMLGRIAMPQVNTKIHYWFAENEQKARKADIKYMKEFFPDTVFGKYPNLGHAGLVLLKPELFAEKMRRL